MEPGYIDIDITLTETMKPKLPKHVMPTNKKAQRLTAKDEVFLDGFYNPTCVPVRLSDVCIFVKEIELKIPTKLSSNGKEKQKIQRRKPSNLS